MTDNVIPVVMVGPESAESDRLLNPNAFPPGLRSSAMACADKLALASYSIRIIRIAIGRDLEEFIGQLSGNAAFKGFIPNPRKRAVAIYHSMPFQAGVQSFFITTKSMLDVFSKIISKAIVPTSNIFSFGKAPFRQKKIAGGRLLNWLEECIPTSYAHKERLIEILLSHIDAWISDVVKLRDDIIHKGQLNDLTEMCVPLSKKPQEITKDEIILPAIRGKGNILEYCRHIREEIDRMLKETVVLLPDVDTKLLTLWDV